MGETFLPSAGAEPPRLGDPNKPGPRDAAGAASGDDGLLAGLRKRVTREQTATADNRKRYEDDLTFLIAKPGEQWDDYMKTARIARGRPVLQFNLLRPFADEISNAIRMGAPGFKVSPRNASATTDAALVLEGAIRSINQESGGNAIRAMAADSMIRGGWGYYGITLAWRVPDEDIDADADASALSDAEDAARFAVEPRLRPIPDALAVHDDADARLPDRSDRRWAVIEEWVNEEDFRARWPNARWPTGAVPESGDYKGWWREGYARIAEYWWVEQERRAARSRDGRRERPAVVRRVRWALCTAHEVLERGDWPGRWIPLIFMPGWTAIVRGAVHLESAIHQGKDPNRAHNYAKTSEVERAGLASLSRWIGPDGFDENHTQEWREANMVTSDALHYSLINVNGQMMHIPPQRVDPPPPSADLIAIAASSKESAYDALGRSAPALARPSGNPTFAQDKLEKMQADQATYHFIDGLKIAMAHEGRLWLDLLPRVFDREGELRTLAPDGEVGKAVVNPQLAEGTRRESVMTRTVRGEDGGERLEKMYSLGVGAYECVAEWGPGYGTQQEAERADMGEMMRNPELARILAPTWVRGSKLLDRETVASLLEATWPEPLQALKRQLTMDGGNSRAAAAQMRMALTAAQQRMQQMMQMIQQQQAALQDKNADRFLEGLKEQMRQETERIKAVAGITGTAMEQESKLIQTEMKTGAPGIGVEAARGVRNVAAAGVARVDDARGAGGGGGQPAPPPGEGGPGAGQQ